jgi:hypothetical protein
MQTQHTELDKLLKLIRQIILGILWLIGITIGGSLVYTVCFLIYVTTIGHQHELESLARYNAEVAKNTALNQGTPALPSIPPALPLPPPFLPEKDLFDLAHPNTNVDPSGQDWDLINKNWRERSH